MRRGRLDREMEEEMRFHLEMQIEQNLESGMATEEARRAANRQFGNQTWLKEASREMRGIGFIETLIQDLRYGLWMLRRSPGFTFVAVLTLALGIGANTAIFSVVNAVLLKPLPYYDPQRLVWVTEGIQFFGEENTTDNDYYTWQLQSKTFEHLVAYYTGNIYLTGRGEPVRLDYIRATANLFPALGVAPQLGRVFRPEEHRRGSEPVAILSHAFWQRRFGGDPAIIGQSLKFGSESRQVVGVMPPNFKFIQKFDALLPLALEEPSQEQVSITHKKIFGRLKPGVSVEQARSELDSLAHPGIKKLYSSLQVSVTPLGERLVGHLRRGLLAQFGAVAFILLIACANVANLMLVRARARQKEMAIRAAMGAGRGRLVRQMLTESLLLSLLFGGVAGLLLSLLGLKALAPLIPDGLSHLKEGGIDGAALGFTFLASLLTGVIAGVIPALQTSQIDLNESLKEGVRNAALSKGKGARRVSPVLVIGQLALTVTLLTGAGLLIKSFLRARAVAPGYNPENLLTMTVPLSVAGYSPSQKKILFQDLLTRINSLPGVKGAAIENHIQLTGRGTVGGRPPAPDSRSFTVPERRIVSVDYFRTMGMQLRAGRGFTEQDNESAPPLVVINETMARREFAGEYPIGKRNRSKVGNSLVDPIIIGVVADMKRYGLEANVRSEMYQSILQNAEVGDISLVVRTIGDPLKLAPAVRWQIWGIDANLPVIDVMTMEQRLAESVAPRRFQTLLFGLFATLALVIAMVGIYGVISYAVSQRTHEIGIRMALGAQARDVLRMLIWRGMRLALIGVAMGLAATLALTRLMQNLLFEVSPTDPATFALIALLLVGVTLIASYIPARRAAKVDPLQSLRHE